MRRIFLMMCGVAVLGMPGTAGSAVMSIGSPAAGSCYDAAKFKRATRDGFAACDRALGHDPLGAFDRAATLVNRGILHMTAGAHDRAIRDYDAALAIEPGLAEAFLNKGVALVRQGDTKAAVNAFDRSIALGPERPEIAYYGRGVAHEMLGDVRSAYFDYRKAASLRPEWDEPRQELTRFSVKDGA